MYVYIHLHIYIYTYLISKYSASTVERSLLLGLYVTFGSPSPISADLSALTRHVALLKFYINASHLYFHAYQLYQILLAGWYVNHPDRMVDDGHHPTQPPEFLSHKPQGRDTSL